MEQVLICGYGDSLSNTATEYNTVQGSAKWNSSADNRTQLISAPGKIKKLRVELSESPGETGVDTYRFTLYVDGAASALTCDIVADDTSGEDTTHEVDVSAGQKVTLCCEPINAPSVTPRARWTLVFESSNAKESNILGTATCVETDTVFAQIQSSMSSTAGTTTENDHRQVIPTSGKIKNLYVELSIDPGTSPDAYTFTLRLDTGGGLADTALTCTIVADDKTGNDTTHEVTVAAGNIVTMEITPVNTPSATPIAWWGCTFEADTDGESIILGGSQNDLAEGVTEYNPLDCSYLANSWIGTEHYRYQLAQECSFKNLYVVLSGAPNQGGDAADAYTFTVRQNEGSPANGLVVTIADTDTTGNDTTHTISISDGDEVSLQCAPTDLPTAVNAYWGLVCYIAPAAPPTAKKVTETFSVTDVAPAIIGHLSLEDTLALADIAPAVTGHLSLSDSLSLAEVLRPKLFKELADTLALADVVSAPRARLTLADSMSLAEVLALNAYLPVSDSLSLADVARMKASLTMPDFLSLADVISPKLFKAITDSLSLADVVSLKAFFTLADSLSHADLVRPPGIRLALTDSLSLADILALRVSLTVADALSLADVVSLRSLVRLADSLSLATLARPPGIKLALTDSLTLADVISPKLFKAITDSLSLADVVSLKAFFTLADSLSHADLVRPPGIRLALTDSLSLADILALRVSLTVADALSIADVTSMRKLLAVSDSLSLAELVRVPRVSIVLADSLNVAEALAISGHLSVVDSFSLADIISPKLFRAVTDSLSLADVVLVPIAVTYVSISDALSLTDAISKLRQYLVLIQVCGRALNSSDIILEIDQTVIEIPAGVRRGTSMPVYYDSTTGKLKVRES